MGVSMGKPDASAGKTAIALLVAPAAAEAQPSQIAESQRKMNAVATYRLRADRTAWNAGKMQDDTSRGGFPVVRTGVIVMMTFGSGAIAVG